MATSFKSGYISGLTHPVFHVYRSTSNQSLTNNNYNKVNFNAERTDTASCFDSTTNYRFTPNVAGKYVFNTNVSVSSGSGSIYLTMTILYFYKNGAAHFQVARQAGTEQYISRCLSGSGIIDMNGTTDYVEVYVYVSSSSGTPAIAPNYASFSGFLLTK